MAAESLQEYLVKLGWDVDKKSFREAMSSMQGFEKESGNFVKKLGKNLTNAGQLLFATISAGSLFVADILDKVSDADRATERFARKMWTTKENARALTTALEAMNASYEDIFWMTPEEYDRMMGLKSFGSKLEAPEELNETLKLVRDIQYEFSRLKVMAEYAQRWVAYYLGRYLGTDLEEIGEKFRNFNDWLAEHIPAIAEKVARVLTVLIRLGKTGVRGLQDLLTLLGRLWNSLSSGSQMVVGFGAAFLGLLKMGPIGLFIGALFLILTLLEDFYAWKDGKPSAFTGLWEGLQDWKNGLNETGELDKFIEKVDGLVGSVLRFFDALVKFGGAVGKWADDVGILSAAYEFFKDVLDGVKGILDTIADLLYSVTGNLDKLSENTLVATKKEYNPHTGQYETSVDWGQTAANVITTPFDWIGKLFGLDKTADYWNSMQALHEGRYDIAGAYNGIYPTAASGGTTVTQHNEFHTQINGYPGETAEQISDRTAREVLRGVNSNNPIR